MQAKEEQLQGMYFQLSAAVSDCCADTDALSNYSVVSQVGSSSG
jgi:hypothetical protein